MLKPPSFGLVFYLEGHLNPVLEARKLFRRLSLAVAVDDGLRKSTGYTRVIKQHTIRDNPHVGANRRVLLECLKNCIYLVCMIRETVGNSTKIN